MRKIVIILIILFISVSNFYFQNDGKIDSVKIIPGIEYKAGWLHKFIFGEHWRNLWTTPITVKILDLDNFAGGLTPLKRGGGFQTKSLRLQGKDGNIWKFRSMAKDPSKVLPEVLRKTVVADIFQDQISSANPVAALVAAPILSSLNILQAKPYLVYMPDDPKLGEFRSDFGGALGMIEIHPDVDEKEGREFEGADKIKSTFKIFDRLAEKRNEKVDAKEYLKARLADIFLGDWDRHTDQWKWARYDSKGKSIWKPIPRDRDQVFAKWDGLGPSIAAYLVPQFVHFDYDYPSIKDITWSGRFIDRRFLTEITKDDWDSVTVNVVSKLTDEVIEKAVAYLPQEYYPLAANELIGKLKSRRDQLEEYSKEYYNLINEVVDIYGTNKDDIVEVERRDNLNTTVTLYDWKKKKKEKKILYKKTFDNSITDDIRIFLLDGDDKAIIKGNVDESPLVRIVGGENKDLLIDSSHVNGYLFGMLPIPKAEAKTEFFDSGKKTKVVNSSGTYFNIQKVAKAKDMYEKYEPSLRDRGSNWLPNPVLGFNSHDGLKIGFGAQVSVYNFRMDPYEYWLSSTVDYATRPRSINFNFDGVFNSIIRGSTVTLNIKRSDLLFTNWYGFGNETTFDKKLDENEFYRMDEELLSIAGAIHLNYFSNFSTNIGFEYKASSIELKNESLLNNLPSKFGLNGFNIFSIFTGLRFDSRNSKYYPEKGIYANLKASFAPKLLDNKSQFLKLKTDIAGYFTLNTFTDITFALKGGGGFVSGEHPFFESTFIGGAENLRGYSRRRFAGDYSIYGQFEVRSYLFPLKVILPGRFGIHTFVETGRVFDDFFTNSDKWHPSYGGGVWMSFIENSMSLSLSVATSPEVVVYYFSLGMGF